MLTELQKSSLAASLRYFIDGTNINGVDFVDVLPSDTPLFIREGVVSRGRCSWFDDKTGKVKVFVPNINEYNVAFFQSEVFSCGLERFGFEGLFKGDSRKVICNSANIALGTRFGDIGELSNFVNRAFMSEENRNRYQSMSRCVNVVFATFGMEYNMKIATGGLFRGLGRYHSSVAMDMAKKGDYSFFDMKFSKRLEQYLDSVPQRNDSVGIGPVSEVFLNLDYPDRPVIISLSQIDTCLKHFGLDLNSLKGTNLPSFIHDPLLVFKNHRPGSDYRPNTEGDITVLVTDKVLTTDRGNDKYLCFNMSTPERQVETTVKYEKEKHSPCRLILTPVLLSDNQICCRLQQKENWMYMRESKVQGREASYDFLVGLDTKIGAAPSPGQESGSTDTQLLTAVTNIAKEFCNPMDAATFFEYNGYDRDPVRDYISKLAEKNKDEAPEVRMSNQSNYVFPKGLFSEAIMKKLDAAGIHDSKDVVRVGFHRFREVTGNDRALTQVAQWMAGKGLYILPKENPVCSNVPTDDDVLAHVHSSLLSLKEDVSGDVALPRRFDGSFFAGSDALHLIMVSNDGNSVKKSPDCPYWATKEELEAFGCSTGKAVAVPVLNGGENAYVYNLSDTGFPKIYKETYNLMMNNVFAGLEYQSSGRYIGTLINMFRNSQDINLPSVCKWLDGNTTDNMKCVQKGHCPSLDDIVGKEGRKEMERKGKAMKFYKYVDSFKSSLSKKPD